MMSVDDDPVVEKLFTAAAAGDYAIIEEALDAGANVNLKDQFEQTLLHCAAKCGQYAVARLLLDRGADINVRSNFGRTPLDDAHLYLRHDVVKMLKAAYSKQSHTTRIEQRRNETGRSDLGS